MLPETNIYEVIFIDKEKCDFIREIQMESACNISTIILSHLFDESKNKDRDKELLMKLCSVGYKEEEVIKILTIMNKE